MPEEIGVDLFVKTERKKIVNPISVVQMTIDKKKYYESTILTISSQVKDQKWVDGTQICQVSA